MKSFRDHIYKIHFCEVLDNLATETENMLTDFGGKQPWKEWIDVVQEIPVYENKLQQAMVRNG